MFRSHIGSGYRRHGVDTDVPAGCGVFYGKFSLLFLMAGCCIILAIASLYEAILQWVTTSCRSISTLSSG